MKVYSRPVLTEARERWGRGEGGGPIHHLIAKAKYLARLGWETIETRPGADLVHVHGPEPEKNANVLTIHAIWPVWEYPDCSEWWYEQNHALAMAMQQARRVIALSQFTAANCRRLAPNVEVTVIPQAIDIEEWRVMSWPPGSGWRARLKAEGRTLVLWGKNVMGPRLRDPRTAFELARRRPDAVVALTGELYHYQLPPNLPENVRLVGRLPFADMQRLVVEADVYLATTLESSGQGHLEAMLCGVPVLGYDWGGVAETVRTGLDGCLVKPGDYDELAGGLDTILAHYEEMSQEASQQARKYSWETASRQLAVIYDQVLKER